MEKALTEAGQFYVVEYKKLCAVITGLREENTRLRDALTVLSKENGPFCCDCPDVREFANAALEGKE